MPRAWHPREMRLSDRTCALALEVETPSSAHRNPSALRFHYTYLTVKAPFHSSSVIACQPQPDETILYNFPHSYATLLP